MKQRRAWRRSSAKCVRERRTPAAAAWCARVWQCALAHCLAEAGARIGIIDIHADETTRTAAMLATDAVGVLTDASEASVIDVARLASSN